MDEQKYASRAGEKLAFALREFSIKTDSMVCADFGCSTGGFTDVLLRNGARKVYAVDTAYGELAWTLRNDPRVIVMEKKNAMHIRLPEQVDLLTVDTSWTKQSFVLPNALANLKTNGQIISLIKPHYEADKRLLHHGKLSIEDSLIVAEETVHKIEIAFPLRSRGLVKSPIEGSKGNNTEYLVYWERVH